MFGRIRNFLGITPPIVHKKVAGLNLRVRDVMRTEPADYDDAWLYALITQSGDMFDIGCNTGFFSLIACLTNPARRVIAADANPQALSFAAENLFLNGISDQVSFVLGFLSDNENEEKTFFTVGTGAAGSMFPSHAKTASAKGSNMQVKTTTLDRVLEKTKVVPSLVKIDIEGAEKFALEGSKKLGSLHKARFFIEMHSNAELSMKENGEAILSWCQALDYDAYYLRDHVLLNSADTFSDRGRCHLLLQPTEFQYPEYLKEIRQGDTIEKAHSVLSRHQLV